MQAEYYSDKSIAVFGDTKPWKNNLMNLGGRFNRNLGGRVGFIFPRTKEAELMQFIAEAQAGMVQPDAQRVVKTPTAPVVQQTQVFTAPEGIYYQEINYTVPYPTVGQQVAIRFAQGGEINYQVSVIENTELPIDSILIHPIEQGKEGELSRATVNRGKWQVEGLRTEHQLVFNRSG